MNTHKSIDNVLFTPLNDREVSVSLAELQQYVSTHQVPARSNRTYAAAAAMALCIGVGLFFILGDRSPEPITAELPPLQQPSREMPAPQAVTVDPGLPAAPAGNDRRKQPASSRRTVTIAGTAGSEKQPGLHAKPVLPDPEIILHQQIAEDCSDPSFLVALARIEYPVSQEVHID